LLFYTVCMYAVLKFQNNQMRMQLDDAQSALSLRKVSRSEQEKLPQPVLNGPELDLQSKYLLKRNFHVYMCREIGKI